LKIPEPKNVAPIPDAATKKALKDMTAESAENRVFYINLGIMKYGTDDKVHAASFVFAAILLVVTVAFYAAGFHTANTQWAEEAVKWSGNTFLFIAGIVLGKASGGKSHRDDTD